MSIFKNIFLFIKKIFGKSKEIKTIEALKEQINNHQKTEFINSIKINIVKKKAEVETLECFGDGLGIQTKISY